MRTKKITTGGKFLNGNIVYKLDFTRAKLRVNDLYIWDKTSIVFAIKSINKDKAIGASTGKYEYGKFILQRLVNERKFDNVELIQ